MRIFRQGAGMPGPEKNWFGIEERLRQKNHNRHSVSFLNVPVKILLSGAEAANRRTSVSSDHLIESNLAASPHSACPILDSAGRQLLKEIAARLGMFPARAEEKMH
jgi:hypothetical protein